MIIILQGLVLVIIIGVIYSLWETAKAYGGLIGTALKFIGAGILFFIIEAFDRIFGILVKLSFIDSVTILEPKLVHLIILLVGLLCSGIGFSKLTRAAK